MIVAGSDFLGPGAHFRAVVLATARAYLIRFSAYTIEMVRWPLGPLFTFATWRITYGVSGRVSVDGATLSGFLLVGIVGMITWTSSIWASGYAIQFERGEGTSAALFLSPASRAAVVAGYGVGSFVWFLPSFIAVGVLGVVTGARFHVTDPLAVVAGAGVLIVASLSVGFALSGLFILSRRGNLIANLMQTPTYILSGLIVPVSALPPVLRVVSDALPVTHAVVALRSSTLIGATLGQTAPEILQTVAVSGVFVIIGLLALRRVEYVAKRFGQLDLY